MNKLFRPSVIVGCANMVSRKVVYGSPAIIASWTVPMSSPASGPKPVNPRIRSSCASISVFMNPRFSEIVRKVDRDIRGRLLVFFPGQYEHNNYRLLDARDGWNYLAIPITHYSEEFAP